LGGLSGGTPEEKRGSQAKNGRTGRYDSWITGMPGFVPHYVRGWVDREMLFQVRDEVDEGEFARKREKNETVR